MRRKFERVEFLPPISLNKLMRLRSEADDVLQRVRQAEDRVMVARDKFELSQQRLAELKKPQVTSRQFVETEEETTTVVESPFLKNPKSRDLSMPNPRRPQHGEVTSTIRPLPPDDPRIIAGERECAQLEYEFESLKKRSEAANREWEVIGQLLGRIEQYLIGVSNDLIEEYEGGPIEPNGKCDFITKVEAKRRRIRELLADRHRVRSAPRPSKFVKAELREKLDQLAARGAPDVMGLIENNSEIVWPRVHSTFEVHAASATAPVRGTAGGMITDTVGLFTWLFSTQLKKKLDEEIDQLSDDENALDDEEREQKLAEIADDLLATERQEEALIEAASDEGQVILRRPNADPRAILLLSSALPNPEE